MCAKSWVEFKVAVAITQSSCTPTCKHVLALTHIQPTEVQRLLHARNILHETRLWVPVKTRPKTFLIVSKHAFFVCTHTRVSTHTTPYLLAVKGFVNIYNCTMLLVIFFSKLCVRMRKRHSHKSTLTKCLLGVPKVHK